MKARRAWTEDEKALLGELAGTAIAATIAARMGRTRYSVLNMTRKLGAHGAPNCRRPWTCEEDEAIRRGLDAGETTRRIGDRIGRKRIAVWFRARALGLYHPWRRYWTAAENARIRAAAGEKTTEQLAAALGRSVRAVRTQAAKLGIRAVHKSHWTARQEEELRTLAATSTAPELAARLGRTVRAVARKAEKLGVVLKRMRGRYWTARQEEELRTLAATSTAPELAARLGRTVRAVARKAEKLGVVLKRMRGRVGVRKEKVAAAPASRPARKPIALAPKPGRIAPVAKPPRMVSVARPALRAAVPKPPRREVEVSRLEWCRRCGAPVSNWRRHYERMGCRRPAISRMA
jgi:DNA-binding CsgD family transcriptional regulator